MILGGYFFIIRNRLIIIVLCFVLGNIGNKWREYVNMKNVFDLFLELVN